MDSIKTSKSENAAYKKLWVFIFLAPFVFGGFHIAVSCVYSVVLLAFLCIDCVLKKELTVKISLPLLVSLVIFIGYFVSVFNAVDSGSAIYGVFKYLPVVLFALCIGDSQQSDRDFLLSAIPLSAAVMTVVSYPLSFIDKLSEFFLVSGRLGGFFQYPNTYAVFCLVGIIISLTKSKLTLKDAVVSAILLAGVLLSGSRSVFVLLIITAVVFVFKLKNKKQKILIITAVAVGLIASVVTVVLTDSIQNAGRFITISLNSSTFLGRILYWVDALPVILKHPLGLGYNGYYYAQQEFQTGVYSVMFIHNDVLQYLLDIGWVPTLAFVVGIIVSFFSKKTSFRQKFLLFILSAHLMFDFDMQFIAMGFLFVLILDWDSCEFKELKIKPLAIYSVCAVSVIPVIFFGLVNFFSLTGNYVAVDRLYPHDTSAQTQLMIEEGYSDTAIAYAESIIKRNGYSSVAHTVLANSKYAQGDIAEYIKEKRKALEISKYSIDEYNDFAYKLMSAAQQYRAYGDIVSAEYCEKEIKNLQSKLKTVEKETNSLAWKIADKPVLTLDSDITEYLESMEGER